MVRPLLITAPLAFTPLLATTAAAAPSATECSEGELGERSYVLCMPATTESAGLIVALHGRGSSGEEMRTVTGLDRYADEMGYAVVFPDGIDQRWGDDTFTSDARPTGDEDVEFLDGLILELAADDRIADEQAGVVGFSNGGSMALRYAAQRPENVCAVVSIAGQLPLDEAIRPTEFVPLLEISGTADPISSYEDGVPANPDRTADDSTPTMPTRDTVDAFVAMAEVDTVTEGTATDPDPGDGTSLVSDIWTFRDGGTVILHTIEGGGHTWPSASSAIRPLEDSTDFGVVSHDLAASADSVMFVDGQDCAAE